MAEGTGRPCRPQHSLDGRDSAHRPRHRLARILALFVPPREFSLAGVGLFTLSFADAFAPPALRLRWSNETG